MEERDPEWYRRWWQRSHDWRSTSHNVYTCTEV